MARIAVLGAGSWALGLAILLNDNKHDVTIWSAVGEEISLLKEDRTNPRYLPGIKISDDICITDNINEAVKDKDIIVLAVASRFIRQTAARLKDIIPGGQIIINVAKGIENGTLMMLSEVIKEELTGCRVCVLSGPSHAEEVARRMPTLVTVASEDMKSAVFIQKIFSSNVFRVYTSTDLVGIEIGGALKNVIALAAGMSEGLGYGDNAKAALITRGINEIARLAIKIGAKQETLYGLSGMGDLIVTCDSMHSRNRRAGILLGQGKSMEDAVKEVNMVVEGIVSAQAAKALATKYDIELPIINNVNRVLFEGFSPREAVDELMLRDLRSE